MEPWLALGPVSFVVFWGEGDKGLAKDDFKTRWESFTFCDLVRLILEILRYITLDILLVRTKPTDE